MDWADYYVTDGRFEAPSAGRSSPTRLTTIRETPSNAPQGQGPFGPNSRSLSGIQPVRLATSMGRAEILAILAPDRLKAEFPNRIG